MKSSKGFLILFGSVFGIVVAILFFVATGMETPVSAETPSVELRGLAFFRGELMETGYVFSPDSTNSGDVIATLIHLGGDEYELRMSDLYDPKEPRLSIWELTISDEGDVGGTFFERQVYPIPESSTFDEIWTHTGCMMVGGFPELTGSWDGERLIAKTVFEGRCEGGTMWGDPEIMMWMSDDDDPDGPMADGLDWNDGRAHMEFGVDVSVVP